MASIPPAGYQPPSYGREGGPDEEGLAVEFLVVRLYGPIFIFVHGGRGVLGIGCTGAFLQTLLLSAHAIEVCNWTTCTRWRMGSIRCMAARHQTKPEESGNQSSGSRKGNPRTSILHTGACFPASMTGPATTYRLSCIVRGRSWCLCSRRPGYVCGVPLHPRRQHLQPGPRGCQGPTPPAEEGST